MARNITITLGDGSTHVYQNAPDSVTPDQVQTRAEQEFGKKVVSIDGGTGAAPAPSVPTSQPSMLDGVKQGAGNLLAGAVRGAGSIGATLMAPVDIAQDALAGKGLSLDANRQRRADMDSALQSLGAQPGSLMFKGGKLAGEIAGTAGAGGLTANALERIPMLAQAAPGLINAVRTNGMAAGTSGPAVNALTRLAGGAMAGGVQAGLVNPEDAGTGAMIGGALPVAAQAIGAGSKAVGRAIRGAPMSPEVKALADRAAELGIDIPADRLVDSKPLNAVASALNYVPMSGRTATEKNMESQLNQALSRTFGQDTPNVTKALRTAGSDLGGKFDTVLQANTVKITPAFKQALADAENQATSELGPEAASIIHKQIAQLQTKGATGEIEGQAAYNIKKALDRIGGGNSDAAFYARDLKKKLMDALNESLGPTEADAFATLRKQYGNMLALENLAQNGGDAGVSVARLGNMKHINNPDLQELADIAAQFVKSREGQHGAMQRGFAALGIGASAGLPALASTMAAGRVTNAALNSNPMKALMTNSGSPQIDNALTKLAPLVYRSAPVLSAQ